MNNSFSQPLLRSRSTQIKPIQIYIDQYQQYILHCKRASNHLTYFFILHIACITTIQVIYYFWGDMLTLKSILFDYLGYVLWVYLLVQYRTSYPNRDPHSIYNKQSKRVIAKLNKHTCQLSLCLMLLGCFLMIHFFMSSSKLMLIPDMVFICLTARSVFQTLLKEKQINRRLQEMENNRLYTIDAFTMQDMKEPFQIQQLQSLNLIRNSSLNHIVPQFMHNFYKPKKQLRNQSSSVQHLDQSQLYSH